MKFSSRLAVGLFIATASYSTFTPAAIDVATAKEQQASNQSFYQLKFDDNSGDLLLKVEKLNQPFLLVTSLVQGVGSNDIGLDRGQLGVTRLVQFERYGTDLILKQLNTYYRADSNNTAEQQAVKNAFAESILWRGKIRGAKQPTVSINSLVVNDLHGVASRLKARGQGNYQLNKNLSLVKPSSIKVFPNNSDVDVLLTFNSSKPGNYAQQVTPDPQKLSIQMRYSMIALPDEGYQARAYDPRSGYITRSFMDYAQPIDKPITQRYLLRHRLQKVNSGSAPSKVKKPIVYYLDRGAPEPIRSALLDGARWWETAFEKAGFIDGFKVELLPEGADPQDVRYNMIQWVHRATRGWSYGSVIHDPRNGEIIKGHVTLGSLRVRQDLLIARGLTAGWEDREAADKASMQMALARIRQLSAHELGHTIGIGHNFAASSTLDASVMDYPHPKITLQDGKVDITNAYGVGVGKWDEFAIQYGYGEFDTPQAQMQSLNALIAQAHKDGLRNIGESDSRAADASQIYASLWDNGSSAIDELKRLQKVRQQALQDFNANVLLEGQPLGELSDTLVPMYLLSRYQINAVAKYIGGTDYDYGYTDKWQFSSNESQRSALSALLDALSPQQLALSTALKSQLLPKAGAYRRTRESFASRLGVINDELGMAEVLGRHIADNILQPRRLNRIDEAHQASEVRLSVTELVTQLLDCTWFNKPKDKNKLRLWMRTNTVVADSLLSSLHHPNTTPEVKSFIRAKLVLASKQLARYSRQHSGDSERHLQWLAAEIGKGLSEPKHKLIDKPLALPPGSPI
ncbi:zinc-dependent metalloprotease [Parashewanella tropica]|uniref:zinc-dependent metalloprotease n=1 Tax=Parashewanella tropica TaxID=2547970 RepID=UPI00105A9E77|nr:zinc-dependent metalloprotease [Parashewanella tropica]